MNNNKKQFNKTKNNLFYNINLIKNPVIEKHYHDFYEFMVVINDGGVQYLNNKKYILKKGQLYFLSPVDFHYFQEYKNINGSFYNIEFLPDILENLKISASNKYDENILLLKPFLNSNNINPLLLPEKLFKKLLFYLNELVELQESKNSMDIDIANKLISIILEYIFSLNIDLVKGNLLSDKIIKYLYDNYQGEIKISNLSEIFNMSASRLAQIFKKYTSMTIIEYLNKIRINKALNLIRNTNIPITRIAFEIGYNDISYFNKTFKKIIGMTPSKYKNCPI